MTDNVAKASISLAKFKLSRRGKKLQVPDDQRIFIILPKDVPERTWSEILQKEEIDLMVLDIREEILEEAFKVCYDKYMSRQKAAFTTHCAVKAWMQLIDLCFYRHDPGEEPSAYPLCYIPKRVESWIPDVRPHPAPKDTWCKDKLTVVEDIQEETIRKWPSTSSIDMPIIEDIPEEYWFPGKVELHDGDSYSRKTLHDGKRGLAERELSGMWKSVGVPREEDSSDSDLRDTSMLLEVTDYSGIEICAKDSSYSALKTTTPVDTLIAPDVSTTGRPKRTLTQKSKLFSKSQFGRSKGTLPPLYGDNWSRISIISDCRLRALRLDTQFEIKSERVDSTHGESIRRK